MFGFSLTVSEGGEVLSALVWAGRPLVTRVGDARKCFHLKIK